MKILFSTVALSLLLLLSSSFTVDKTPVFIQTFQDIAVAEMQRTQIPASITMAQAIIESAWGNGVLARSSNNFFGIKCKKNWEGATYYIEDDDYNSKGSLMKSCFRAYETIEESFVDHSDFLVGNPRYAELFKLSPKDYIGWAYGLKACGYATDAFYAEKLIKKIEEYHLYDLDAQMEVLEAPEYSVEDFKTTKTEFDEILEAPTYLVQESNNHKDEIKAIEIPADSQPAPASKKQSMIIGSNYGAIVTPNNSSSR